MGCAFSFPYAFTAEWPMVIFSTILPVTRPDALPRVMAGVGLSAMAPALCYPFADRRNRDMLAVIGYSRRRAAGCTITWMPSSPSAISTRCHRGVDCSTHGAAMPIRARPLARLHLSVQLVVRTRYVRPSEISWEVGCAVLRGLRVIGQE
jgi:hypothetical protein